MNDSPYSIAALKRSAVHFLTGKAASALLTLVTLLWLVRLLAVEEYGVYVILVAGMELALAITSFGLPWVAARYLPEFRLHASGKLLVHFVWQVIARMGLFLVAGALLLFMAAPWLMPSLELAQYTDMARLYLLVLLLEGLGRRIRENILGSLMQQRQAQISLVARNLALLLLLLLGVVAAQGVVYLHHVVLAELAASALGAALALHSLVRHLHVHRDLSGQGGWQPPNWPDMWRVARHMYFSQLVTLTYSPQVFVFLIQRYLGVEATALFGFLRSLYMQICHYLPAKLLFGLIRPKLVASYVGAGGMGELTHNANLAGKLSLFVLMPLVLFAWLAGGELLNLLSGGKFNQAGYYLAGLLLALIPLSQQQILATVAVASDNSHLSSWGSSLGMLALPLAYWLFEADQGLWGPIVAIIVSQILFNATIIAVLVRTTTYRPDAIGFFKLIAAALAGFVLMQSLAMPVHGWSGLLVMAALAGGLFLLAAYFLKPFRVEERARLNRLLNRKIFIW
ncbi:MAG: oligosaccharide flippase family protein [Nitrosomonas sp.]|nr:oligosaccharide flippase family protein [Nitrosomonas sp.]MDP1951502.1 oligosaccharide flippase family protein [Nitrosomonas sp.]